jgi:HSP20 family protein
MANLIRRNERPEEMTPSAWEPLRLMRHLFSWDPFAEMFPTGRWEVTAFAPRFEVKETKDAYVFKADLPGVEEKDLDITLTGNRITVSGTREAEERKESETYYAFERSYGSFSRAFTLPEGADVEHCEADLKAGVLTLSVPKRAEHLAKKISLKTIGEKVKGALGGKEKGTA